MEVKKMYADSEQIDASDHVEFTWVTFVFACLSRSDVIHFRPKETGLNIDDLR